MNYSYSQMSLYQTCPRKYRYKYIDGWREKELSASLVFGRCFEDAIAALYRGQDPGARFFDQWEHWKHAGLEWPKSETWESMYRSGITLLEIFASQQRIQIADPQHHLQIEVSKMLAGGRKFVGVVDAIGSLDGVKTVIDWKTAAMRMSSDTESLACLDPQLGHLRLDDRDPQRGLRGVRPQEAARDPIHHGDRIGAPDRRLGRGGVEQRRLHRGWSLPSAPRHPLPEQFLHGVPSPGTVSGKG